jgi:Zn-dependent M32 family carboxypeptidase
MRTIRTTTNVELPLDGDLMTLLETLFEEVTVKKDLDRTFEDMMRELNHVVDQMNEDERRAYFLESLFLNTVTYENERLAAVVRDIAKKSALDSRSAT